MGSSASSLRVSGCLNIDLWYLKLRQRVDLLKIRTRSQTLKIQQILQAANVTFRAAVRKGRSSGITNCNAICRCARGRKRSTAAVNCKHRGPKAFYRSEKPKAQRCTRRAHDALLPCSGMPFSSYCYLTRYAGAPYSQPWSWRVQAILRSFKSP